jgi:four helix bundle protein
MPGSHHRKPAAWQCAIELVPRVYVIAWALPRDERYRLGDRLRGAVCCIPASVAGACRAPDPRDCFRQLATAGDALMELDDLLFEVARLDCSDMAPLLDDMTPRLARMDAHLQGWNARLTGRCRRERRRLGPTSYNARPLDRLPVP